MSALPDHVSFPTDVLADCVCPNCHSSGAELFYRVDTVPVHSCLLMASREEALSFRCGPLSLAVCHDCGFLFNTEYDSSLQNYSQEYEETQGFSETFNRFARDLVDQLVAKHDLRNKTALEIGCGKGEFLVCLCEAGPNTGIGLDPSYRPERTTSTAQIDFIQDFYSEKYTDLQADFVCCRHTLEHIGPTGEFMAMVRRSIADKKSIVFFELPEGMRVLREGAFWDMYYEHCTYYTPGSLARVFRDNHFEVTEIELVYDDQYLLITGLPVDGPTKGRLPEEESVADVRQAVADFRKICADKIGYWTNYVRDAHARGERVVLWGSGSKGVSFLTTCGLHSEVEYVVDINPHKHGRFMPITGQEIVGPDRLVDYQPQHVIAMNPIYTTEIQADLDRLGVPAKLVAV